MDRNVKRFEDCIAEREDLLRSLDGCAPSVQAAVAAIARAIEKGGRVFFFGNGGSAAQAQHLAAELCGRFVRERRAYGGIALTVDTSALTAIANDYGFEQVFARQLEGLAQPGDVAVALTTSGDSPNVINGLRTARAKGAVGVAITGARGGAVVEHADIVIRGPNGPSWKVQEGHLAIGHILCELIETTLAAP